MYDLIMAHVVADEARHKLNNATKHLLKFYYKEWDIAEANFDVALDNYIELTKGGGYEGIKGKNPL